MVRSPTFRRHKLFFIFYFTKGVRVKRGRQRSDGAREKQGGGRAQNDRIKIHAREKFAQRN